MPDAPDQNRVIITVHVRGLTDAQIGTLRAGIKKLIDPHAGAIMKAEVVDQVVTPAAKASPTP